MLSLEEAVALHQQGHYAKAQKAYEAILQLQPQHPDALHLLGLILYIQGDYGPAIELIQQALQVRPQSEPFNHNLANIYLDKGDLESAKQHYLVVVAVNPLALDDHLHLGRIGLAQHDWALALTHYEQAYQLNSDDDLLLELGPLYHWAGRRNDAIVAYGQALDRYPQEAELHNNLGVALYEAGLLQEAETHLATAIQLQPQMAAPQLNLGLVRRRQDRLSEALDLFKQATQLDPDSFEAWLNLGALQQWMALLSSGDIDTFKIAYERALVLRSTDALRLILATLLPPIYATMADRQYWREQFRQKVAALSQETLHIASPLEEIPAPHFYLAYQGENDCELNAQLAKIYRQAAPSLTFNAPHCRQPRTNRPKIRIGFVSGYFRNHSIGKFIQGVIEHWDRQCFEVLLFCFPGPMDETNRRLRACCTTVDLPYHLGEAQNQIAARELDILFYPDIGMTTMSYFLAFARLAPLQCVTWGHGVTTGIDTIDVFITNEAPHTELQQWYQEKLIVLSHLLPDYVRPTEPNLTLNRDFFGLPEHIPLYICPQSLFKIHPEDDALFVAILERDPQGQMVVLGNPQDPWPRQLQARWHQSIPAQFHSRLLWHPPVPTDFYASLIACCDVMLDPVRVGGGNSTYDALVSTTPIVTCPGPRSWVTAACYRQMGWTKAITTTPQEYVDLAVKLGQDRILNRQYRQEIQAALPRLYDQSAGIRELEQALMQWLQL